MKRNIVIIMVAVFVFALCVPAAFGQMATIKGSVKDFEGKPVVGASVEYHSTDTGRKYTLKTDKSGNYFSIGVAPGIYTVTLTMEGKPPIPYKGIRVSLAQEANIFDINLQQEQARAEQQLSPEQKAQIEQRNKEASKIKGLNEKLAQANQLSTAGDYEAAVTVMTEATAMDGTRDLLWGKLADVERLAGNKLATSGDRDTAKLRWTASIEHYQKAIELKPSEGAYYNNMGESYAKLGKSDDAIKQYTLAAQNDPTKAGQYYFNLGAVLTNAGKVDEALAAFEKSIAADPARADSYYWKGVNLMGKATTKGNTMVAPEGTAEAFNKYLELDPEGKFADPAKQMLASIGAKVETTFGKRATGTKKK